MSKSLEAILILHQKRESARSIDLAEHMGYSKESVSVAMKQLRSKDYITVEDRGSLHLSQKGQLLTSQVYERYNFFTKLFSQMGVPIEIAKKDACSIEHIISTESYEKLKCAFA